MRNGGLWPAIDFDYYLNPTQYLERPITIYSVKSPVSQDAENKCEQNKLAVMLTTVNKDEYPMDFYLYEMLVKAIDLFDLKKFDDCLTRAELACFARARLCEHKTKISIKKLNNGMPEDLKENLHRLRTLGRNPITHQNKTSINLELEEAAKMLAAAILSFYYYRYRESLKG